jgi:hypothetical protein
MKPGNIVILTGKKVCCEADDLHYSKGMPDMTDFLAHSTVPKPMLHYAELSPKGWVRLQAGRLRRATLHPELARGLRTHPMRERKRHEHRHRKAMCGVLKEAVQQSGSKILQARAEHKHRRRLSAIIREAANKGAVHPALYEQKQATRKRLSIVLQEVVVAQKTGEISAISPGEAFELNDSPPPPPPSEAPSMASSNLSDNHFANAPDWQSKMYTGSTPPHTPRLEDPRDRSESLVSALTTISVSPASKRTPLSHTQSKRAAPSKPKACSVNELASTPGRGRTQGVAANVLRHVLRGLREKDMAELAIEDLRALVSSGAAVVGSHPAKSEHGSDFGGDAHSVFSEQPLRGAGHASDISPRKKELLLGYGRYSPDKTDANFAPNSPSAQERKQKAARQQQQRPAWTKHFVAGKL